MSTQEKPTPWPANSVPERWVEALFSAMSATYGARFADLWRGSKIEHVKRNWGIELFKLTREQIKAGRENLSALVKPPTLPEFVAHCRSMREEQQRAQLAAPRLEDRPTISPEKAQENMQRVRDAASIKQPEPTVEWAFSLIMRGASASGKPLPHDVRRCAADAITSRAGARVVSECADPALKAQYAKLRQAMIDDYGMRGIRLWNV